MARPLRKSCAKDRAPSLPLRLMRMTATVTPPITVLIHLYEGRFSPRVSGKRIAKNTCATAREECEEKLKVLIAEMKKEIAEIKAGEKATNKG